MDNFHFDNYERSSLKRDDVLAVFTDLFTRHEPPEYIRSDNGSKFTVIAVREGLEKVKNQTLYITLGSSWETAAMKTSTISFAMRF